jgi:hypothetical protein
VLTPIRWPLRMWRPVSSSGAFQLWISGLAQSPAFLLLVAQRAPKHCSVWVELPPLEPALQRRKLASRSR